MTTRAGQPRGARKFRLPLLPSGPDGVGRFFDARDPAFNAAIPPAGGGVCISVQVFSPAAADCGLQGAANAPLSAA